MTRFSWPILLLLNVNLILVTGPVAAQVVDASGGPKPPAMATVELLDSAELAHLARVEALMDGGQALEAIETLRRIIDGHGDKLVGIDREMPTPLSGFQRHVPAREYCLARLARLAEEGPEAFATYRRQMDSTAARYLATAIERNDEALLRRVASDFFLSSVGDDALLRLGELAVGRGHYNEARRWWERIHPSLRFPDGRDEALRLAAHRPLWLPFRGADVAAVWPKLAPHVDDSPAPREGDSARFIPPFRLVYPDTDLPLADVRARLVVTSLLEGNLERARIELELLRQVAPQARGKVGGIEGNWVDLLEAQLTAASNWPHAEATANWPTFSGNRARSAHAAGEVSSDVVLAWSVELPRIATPRELLSHNRLRVAEEGDGILAYHPVVIDDTVVVQRGVRRDQVAAYDLETGERRFPLELSIEEDSRTWSRPILGVPRYTLTAHDDRLYIRTGVPVSLSPTSRERLAMPAKLEALDLRAEGKLLWSLALEPPLWDTDWTWGGPPVCDSGSLYVSAVRRGPLRLEVHVVALDALDGRVRWRRLVAAGEPWFDESATWIVHNLLTLHQGVVYCNTNAGAVAALDADSGAVRWVTTYPRAPVVGKDPDRNDLHLFRDLNPCLVERDLVIVAPADCNRLFALDATTGMLLWSTRQELAADVVHLLGVGGNNVVASGECLYWLDAYSGELRGQFPGPFHPAPGFARPHPRGYGRGVLADGHVYWPTRDAIYVFDQATRPGPYGGTPNLIRQIPLAWEGGSGGHLIVTGDALLVAGPDRLDRYERRVGDGAAQEQDRGFAEPPPAGSGLDGDVRISQ